MPRLFKHLFTSRAKGRRAFPEATLAAIQAAIAEGEARHRAEVRLVIEPALALYDVLRDQTPRERARELFSLYEVWDTEENCGVLIYINLADRKVEIMSDRNVGRALRAEEWQAVCKTMTEGFAHGDFHESALAAIRQLNDFLQTRFAAAERNADELPNAPIVI